MSNNHLMSSLGTCVFEPEDRKLKSKFSSCENYKIKCCVELINIAIEEEGI